MLILLLTFVIGLLLARWVCYALPVKWWVTALIIVAGMVLAPVVGFLVGAFVGFASQNEPGFNANLYLADGLRFGAMLMVFHPVMVWAFRYQRKKAAVTVPSGIPHTAG